MHISNKKILMKFHLNLAKPIQANCMLSMLTRIYYYLNANKNFTNSLIISKLVHMFLLKSKDSKP